MIYISHLNQYPYSPRKIRVIANIIRKMNVIKALQIITNINKHADIQIAKFLRSAILNCQLKDECKLVDKLYIKEIKVNSSRVLKRLRPAPQGKGHIIRKKFSNISIILDYKF
jgi:large subunit ribosomal protein L22